MPGVDEPHPDGHNMADGAFEAMLETFDQDALEADREPVDTKLEPHLLEAGENEEHDGDVMGEDREAE